MEEDAVITPEDEEVEDAEFTEGEATPKVSKKKVIKVEENRSKREHVNVVFIGHVGELPATIEYRPYSNSLTLIQMLVNQQSVDRSCH